MDNPLKYIDPDGMWTETANGYTSDNAAEAQAFFKQLQSSQQSGDDKDKDKKKKPDPKPKAKEKDDPISHKVSRWTNYLAAGTIVVGLGPEDPVADVAAGGEELIGQGAAGLIWLGETAIDLYSLSQQHMSFAKKTPSINQLQKSVEQGKAPDDIDRFDKGNEDHNEKDHVHFKTGEALNKDGTWKHGSKALSNAVKTFLKNAGWQLPK